MELKETDRLRTRLLAIDIRLAELSHQMERTQIRVHQLESALQDSRLAGLMGEDAGNSAELGVQLERSRLELEGQLEVIAGVKKSQSQVRGQWGIACLLERRAERERREQESAG